MDYILKIYPFGNTTTLITSLKTNDTESQSTLDNLHEQYPSSEIEVPV